MAIWRWTALFGLAVVAFMLSFGAISGRAGCAVAPDPILAFELVRSPAEVAALFPERCRPALVAAQRLALRVDTLGFVPVYTIFLILSARAARRTAVSWGRTLAKPAMLIIIAAAICDLVENSRLASILAGLPGGQNDIDILFVAARAKFVLLGTALMLIGLSNLNSRGWQRWLAVATVIGGPLCSVAVLADPGLVPFGASLAWFSLLLITFTRALRPPRPPVP